MAQLPEAMAKLSIAQEEHKTEEVARAALEHFVQHVMPRLCLEVNTGVDFDLHKTATRGAGKFTDDREAKTVDYGWSKLTDSQRDMVVDWLHIKFPDIHYYDKRGKMHVTQLRFRREDGKLLGRMN